MSAAIKALAQPAPRTRREWLAIAETVELRVIDAPMLPNEHGGITWIVSTPGPHCYVRCLAERLAAQLGGFVVAKVQRDRPDLRSPITGKRKGVYVVRLERLQ